MTFYARLLANHPLANIAFVVTLIMGVLSYTGMPREQDPEINFNWVNITTVYPGATSDQVERLVTNPLEDAINGVRDVRFVSSNSKENVSSILVRFYDLSEREFDKRINDLRRDIQNKASAELPSVVKEPSILEITTSNGFPTAQVTVEGQADDEVLRLNARRVRDDLEAMAGVDQVFAAGLREPELRVHPDATALAARGLTVSDVADSLQVWWRDTAAGTLQTHSGAWAISVSGVNVDPAALSAIPLTRQGQSLDVRLGDVARIERARARATQLASSNGQTAVSLSVTKKSKVNTLDLVNALRVYIADNAARYAQQGITVSLSDDQTVPTRSAIDVMQTNALYGAVLVMLVSWVFVGWRVALLITLGIPFSLLATFGVLSALGFTVNVSVLLGVVIALGMLVDDAVVIAEAIYYRVARGQSAMGAAVDAVREVGAPVLASVATTMAAFLPLMLLPGIVGKFMFVIPFVVTLALAISLIEAFWMMPVHLSAVGLQGHSDGNSWHDRFNRRIRMGYGRALAYVLRRPKRFAAVSLLVVCSAGALLATGVVRVQFFAFDPIRLFYVNVDMPTSASLDDTLAATQRVEQRVREQLQGVGPDAEARSVISRAGLKFTDTEPLYGDSYGQILVSLNPRSDRSRDVVEVVDSMRQAIEGMDGPGLKSFTVLAGGPPAGKAISIKIRGNDFAALERASEALRTIVKGVPGTQDVQDDDLVGRPQLVLTPNAQAMADVGLNAGGLARLIRLNVDGEVIAFTREAGDKIELRVMGRDDRKPAADLNALLDAPVALPGGRSVRLGALVEPSAEATRASIRHYNFKRTITVSSNLDKDLTDTAAANALIKERWEAIAAQHPQVTLDFSGELEDIQESLDAMKVLFLLGVGLIYLILAAQFSSYFQPLMILVTVPLAFTGVAFGLGASGNPLSLYTLYGVIALTGIAVNSAIVLIDAANERLHKGMALMHAIMHASRRRVVPILITTTTTIGGLSSLAFGLGGKSLLWGPVAASIVWGLAFSTLLTLFVVPLLYTAFMRPARPHPTRRWRLRWPARQA
jgi:multidrug efflux pump subunit AcrB